MPWVIAEFAFAVMENEVYVQFWIRLKPGGVVRSCPTDLLKEIPLQMETPSAAWAT